MRISILCDHLWAVCWFFEGQRVYPLCIKSNAICFYCCQTSWNVSAPAEKRSISNALALRWRTNCQGSHWSGKSGENVTTFIGESGENKDNLDREKEREGGWGWGNQYFLRVPVGRRVGARRPETLVKCLDTPWVFSESLDQSLVCLSKCLSQIHALLVKDFLLLLKSPNSVTKFLDWKMWHDENRPERILRFVSWPKVKSSRCKNDALGICCSLESVFLLNCHRQWSDMNFVSR